MKYTKRFITNVLAYGAAVVAMSLLTTLQAAEGSAKVRAIHGTAKHSSGKGVWLPVKVGTVLKSGSIVKTDADSTVDLFLGDNGPVIRVTPDTQLALDKLSIEDNGIDKVIETQLDLSSGRILGNVKKLAAASKYEIKTPQGVAGIRGTEYVASANGTITCVSGIVVIVPFAGGGAITIKAGETYTPGAGGTRGTVGTTPQSVLDAIQPDVDIIRKEGAVVIKESAPPTTPVPDNNPKSPIVGEGNK